MPRIKSISSAENDIIASFRGRRVNPQFSVFQHDDVHKNIQSRRNHIGRNAELRQIRVQIFKTARMIFVIVVNDFESFGTTRSQQKIVPTNRG
ncbi:MAG TPA: hypothetical protein VNI84_05590 [Pyrinomonadaceae bacterium]|nr:hypothetical protein [Pyrinomonadaceae bacterium]